MTNIDENLNNNFFKEIKKNNLEDLISFSKTIRVLYVDSDLEHFNDIFGLFKIFFHDIDIAHDGYEGFELFKKNKYDLIISAIDMPKINGIEMISKIREISRHITILTLSSEQKGFIDLIRLGIDGYILKPVEVKQFVSIVQKVIEKLENKQDLYNYRINLEKIVEEKTNELSKINQNLEKIVEDEVKKNKEFQEQLNHQAKLASMGEMMSNIAHQWRQPLSVISTISTGLELKIDHGIFNENEAKKDLNHVDQMAQHLSSTIDTFRNFMSNDKILKEVVLQKEIDSALDIVISLLKTNHINLINNINYDLPIKTKLISGELSQVIINIISNAKDALIEKNKKNAWVKVDLEKLSDKIVIKIEDNAGGIPDKILSRIFEPYFTTKYKSHGTGLGLYMSYKIITESLNGNLYAQNNENGAVFFIELPLS